MLSRYTMSRVMFTTGTKFVSWAECMNTCPKYNRAQAPSIASRAGLQELVSWTHTTIRDPDTRELYPGVGRFQGLWLPYRYLVLTKYFLFIFVLLHLLQFWSF